MFVERQLIEPLVEDGLDGAIAGVVKAECAITRGFQTFGTKGFFEPDDALRGPQVIEHTIGKQPLDERVARSTDRNTLLQTPLRVLHEVSDGFRRQMVTHGVTVAGMAQSWVRGDEFEVFEDPGGGLGGGQPQLTTHELIRHGVLTLLELDVGVAVHLDLGPHRELGRTVWQCSE